MSPFTRRKDSKVDAAPADTTHNKDLEKHIADAKFYEADAGDGTTVFDQYMTGLPLYACFASLFICLFLIGLDQTIIATLLSTIGEKFDAYNQIGWIASGYMLTMAVFCQTWGKLSIIFGRKYSLLLAIVLFEAGSLMCALAQDMNVLIGGRVLAGIGGGGIQTLVFIVGTEMVPISQRAFAFAFFGVSFAASTIVGPIVGGAFAEHASWRWAFYINLPIGGIAFVMLVLLFHPPIPKFTWKEKLAQIDYTGVFLLTSGLVIFLLAITFGGEQFAWGSGAVISCFVIGGVLLIIFCIWNFKFSTHQTIPYHIIKVPGIDFPVLLIFTCFYSFMGVVVYVSEYFQVVKGLKPLATGIHFFPAIIPMVLGSIASGILIKKTRQVKPLAMFGAILAPIGYGILALLDVDSSSSAEIGLLILPGLSAGIILQAALMAAQLSSPKLPGSTILTTALFNFSRSLGGAIGGDLGQTIFNSSVKDKVTDAVKANPTAFIGMDQSQLSAALSNPSLLEELPDATRAVIIKCIMDSIRNVFYTCAAVGALGFVFSCFCSNKMVPPAEDMESKEEAEMHSKDENEAAQFDATSTHDGQQQKTDLEDSVDMQHSEETQQAVEPVQTQESEQFEDAEQFKDAEPLKEPVVPAESEQQKPAL